MPAIINLISLYKPRPINRALFEFILLCDRYSKGWLSCTYFSQHYSNHAWVKYQYYRHIGPLINNYQLGKIDTNVFLNSLLNIFYFLKNKDIQFTQYDKDKVWNQRNKLVTLQSITDQSQLANKRIALALLEIAWNHMIEFDAEVTNYMLHKLSEMKENNIIIVGNTNPLHLKHILDLIEEQQCTSPIIQAMRNILNAGNNRSVANAEAANVANTLASANRSRGSWNTEVDISTTRNELTIKVASNIFLCPSYRAKALITPAENHAVSNPGSSLLEKLFTHLGCSRDQVQLFSEESKDLEAARSLGIPERNIHETKTYFSSGQHVKAA
jgi:hypothetical protein